MKVYCPRCGQEQISAEVRFCSRCGFLMTGLAQVVFNGGMQQQLEPSPPKPPSPRRKGLKQGGGWFLLGAFIVPILLILSDAFNLHDAVPALAAVIFFLGGFLRMLFALLFESGNPADKTLEENVVQTARKILKKQPPANSLPPSQSIPVDAYAPPRATNWRDTNDLEPSSVTDKTTKLLEKNR